jgi:hypothetical protein
LLYLLSVLAACVNAVSSVVQRKANKDLPVRRKLSLGLIVDLLHTPLWFVGIVGIIAGFLLQAAALSVGALSVVQPVEDPCPSRHATGCAAGTAGDRILHRCRPALDVGA